jgi:mannosyltransferase OCH1-like enzyme
MIPKIIHYCWFGDAPIPENYLEYIQEWGKLNPGYKIIKWDEKNSPLHVPYIRKAISLKNWANVSNLVRFLALKDQGGIYMDTDMKLLKPLKSLLNNDCFLGFQEGSEGADDFWVNNAIMGAVPGHPFIELCADGIVNQFDGTEAANLSAPHIVTNLLRQNYKLKKYGYQKLDDITLYPKEVFYPIHYDEAHKIKEFTKYITDDTIGIHVWARTWFSRETMLNLIDDYRAGNKELVEINAGLSSELAALKVHSTTDATKLSIATEKISKQTSKIAELEQLVRDLTEQVASSVEERSGLRSSNINLFEKQMALLNQIVDAEKANTVSRVRVKSLEGDLALGLSRIETLTQQLKHAEDWKAEQEKQIQESKALAITLSERFKNQLGEKDKTIQILEAQLSKETLENEKLQALIVILQNNQAYTLQGLDQIKETLELQKHEQVKDRQMWQIVQVKCMEEIKAEQHKSFSVQTDLSIQRLQIEHWKTSAEIDAKNSLELRTELATLKRRISDQEKELTAITSQRTDQSTHIVHLETQLNTAAVREKMHVEKLQWFATHYEQKSFFQALRLIFEIKILKRNPKE